MSNTMKKVFCCYLDVLGFKQKLLSKSEIEQTEIIHSLYPLIILSNPKSLISETNKNIKRKNIDLSSINTNSILVSDSIILWTKNCEYENVIEFIYRIQSLLRNTFIKGFPLRGAISYGGLFHQEKKLDTFTSYNHFNLIVGNALVSAYENEKKFEWMGCTFNSECFEELKKIISLNNPFASFKTNKIFKENIVVPYEPSQKTGIVETLYTINWLDLIVIDYHKKNRIIDFFMGHSNYANLTPEVRKKIDNTNKYINFIVENKFVHKPFGM